MSEPITREQLLANRGQVKVKALLNGPFGVGKTYTAMTSPKWAYAMIEPNGLATALVPENTHLLANMVYYESFVPQKDEEPKVMFERLSQFLGKVREDAKAGKVETLILDNLSHLAENRWIYIEQHEVALHKTSTGAVNTLSMYNSLGRWLYKFVLTEVISLPCHVMMTCHEMDEEEVQQTAGGEKRVKTGRVLSNILGGFRKDAAGLVNLSAFLERQVTAGKVTFRARCLPGNGKPAKNNLGLPEFVENISFQSLMGALNRGVAQGGTGS